MVAGRDARVRRLKVRRARPVSPPTPNEVCHQHGRRRSHPQSLPARCPACSRRELVGRCR
jgi:hypothetical protein